MPMTTRNARGPAQVLLVALGVLAALLLGPLPAAQAAVSGTVDVASGDTLRVRSQPNTTSTIVANLADGSSVSISCKVTGTTVTGTFGTTSVWYKISQGYATAAYVRAASTVSSCTTSSSPTGTVDVASGTTLNVRSGPGSGYSVSGTLADGATVALSCQTTGTQQSGTFGTTSVWYKISSGYVTAAYVRASTTPTTCSTTTPAPSPSGVRSEMISRADYWYRASNGMISGVAAFGRNPDLSAPEPSPGTRRYRRDCSGLIAMSWQLVDQPNSYNLNSSTYSTPVSVTNLQPGDILTTRVTSGGHVTMFHKWYDKATWRYYAYDFGGGSGGSGPVEHKVYQLTAVSGGTAKRVNDSRQYYAYRSVKTPS